MAKAKPTRAMSLIILFLPYKNTAGAAMSEKQSGCGVVPDFGESPPKIGARNSFPRQGAKGRGSPAEPPFAISAADILGHGALGGLSVWQAPAQKRKGPAQWPVPPLALAFL